MTIVVDSSIWIGYFRSAENAEKLDFLIDENQIATNDVILAELIPFLKLRNQRKLIDLLNTVYTLELSIQWGGVIEWQYQCLTNGVNGVGIPDLIIAQNTIQNDCMLYSLDRHFQLLKKIIPLKVFR